MSARRKVPKIPHLFRDQYGECYRARTVKELREKLGGKVSIMYRDTKDGKVIRVGYVVGRHWLTEYAPVILPA